MSKRKKLTNKDIIEQNRVEIVDLMHHACKNIANASIHMLKHELAETEPMILSQQQMPKGLEYKEFVEWANTTYIPEAYKFVLENKSKNKYIDIIGINALHDILITDTDVPHGTRKTMARVLGEFAPNPETVLYKLDDIQYHLHDKSFPVLTRAFDTHFDFIMAQPYTDYNKRTARVLMNWFLIQNNYTPIVFNKEGDSENYTRALHQRLDGNRRAYTEYMESSMLHTQNEILNILRRSR